MKPREHKIDMPRHCYFCSPAGSYLSYAVRRNNTKYSCILRKRCGAVGCVVSEVVCRSVMAVELMKQHLVASCQFHLMHTLTHVVVCHCLIQATTRVVSQWKQNNNNTGLLCCLAQITAVLGVWWVVCGFVGRTWVTCNARCLVIDQTVSESVCWVVTFTKF